MIYATFALGCIVGGAVIWWIHSLDRDTPPPVARERVVDAQADLGPETKEQFDKLAYEYKPALEILARSKVKPSQIRNDSAQLSALGRHADDWKE